jgi:hypothetical protein
MKDKKANLDLRWTAAQMLNRGYKQMMTQTVFPQPEATETQHSHSLAFSTSEERVYNRGMESKQLDVLRGESLESL